VRVGNIRVDKPLKLDCSMRDVKMGHNGGRRGEGGPLMGKVMAHGQQGVRVGGHKVSDVREQLLVGKDIIDHTSTTIIG
jgi:hypothetical protein